MPCVSSCTHALMSCQVVQVHTRSYTHALRGADVLRSAMCMHAWVLARNRGCTWGMVVAGVRVAFLTRGCVGSEEGCMLLCCMFFHSAKNAACIQQSRRCNATTSKARLAAIKSLSPHTLTSTHLWATCMWDSLHLRIPCLVPLDVSHTSPLRYASHLRGIPRESSTI